MAKRSRKIWLGWAMVAALGAPVAVWGQIPPDPADPPPVDPVPVDPEPDDPPPLIPGLPGIPEQPPPVADPTPPPIAPGEAAFPGMPRLLDDPGSPQDHVRQFGARSPGAWVRTGLDHYRTKKSLILHQSGGAEPIPIDQVPLSPRQEATIHFLEGMFDVIDDMIWQLVIAMFVGEVPELPPVTQPSD